MRKNKLLLLLALLMTAATGAWAEDIVISPASGADISTALATATDGKTVGNITINLAQNGAYTVSSAMEVPAGLTINGNGATINAESLTEGNGMFLGTGKDSPTRADIQISDLTIKSLGKSLYYSNGQNNYGDFIMNNCLVEVTSSVIVFNYTKGSAVVNLTLTNSTFYAPTATTTQFYSSQSGQKLSAIIDATQEFSFQNCTLYNMAKNKNFFVHRQNNQSWLSYEAKNSIFVNCGKSGEVVKGMNGGSTSANPTWSIDGNLFNYDGADTSANETTGDTSEGEGVQNSVAGVVTFKDPSNGDFSGIITKSDNSTVDLTLGDSRWTAAAEPTTYSVTMKDGVKDADKWTVKVGDAEKTVTLPITNLKGGETVTLKYNGRLKVKGVKATSDAAPEEPAVTWNTVDLSTLTADYAAQNGDVLTGETSSYKVTIAAGATVTLDGASISSSGYCIRCAGDATIILKDGSTNTLTGTGQDYPALWAGDANTTLTIQGSTGVLNVTSGDYCAGIGGGFKNTKNTCGNIRIEGGVITAQGGEGGSGIGTDDGATCGDIIITGGTITANGGNRAAGIGTGSSGYETGCGNITIANTVTKVTATKGENAPHSIGKGYGGLSTCGTVTIGCTLDTNGNPVGGTKYWENNAAVNGGDTYLAQSPLIYDPTN